MCGYLTTHANVQPDADRVLDILNTCTHTKTTNPTTMQEIAYHMSWLECTKEWDIGSIDYVGNVS
jgi:hypothetical protein